VRNLAKANLSEWANFHSSFSFKWMGVHLGTTKKSIWYYSQIHCGSSAGSGASVSANLAVFAIGTETNGSLHVPAKCKGLVGIKTNS